MTNLTRAALPAALILLAACSPSMQSGDTGAVRLSVQPETAAPADSVVLTLTNDTAGQVGYNLCASSLERRTGAGWEVVPSDVVCTMELRILDGAGTATHRAALPGGLSGGEYRYVTTVEDFGTNERHDVASSAFRVEP